VTSQSTEVWRDPPSSRHVDAHALRCHPDNGRRPNGDDPRTRHCRRPDVSVVWWTTAGGRRRRPPGRRLCGLRPGLRLSGPQSPDPVELSDAVGLPIPVELSDAVGLSIPVELSDAVGLSIPVELSDAVGLSTPVELSDAARPSDATPDSTRHSRVSPFASAHPQLSYLRQICCRTRRVDVNVWSGRRGVTATNTAAS